MCVEGGGGGWKEGRREERKWSGARGHYVLPGVRAAKRSISARRSHSSKEASNLMGLVCIAKIAARSG